MTEVRKALADSFKELMTEKSFQKIIVKDITDRAHVKRPTFYTYFRDKYDVIEWIFAQEIWTPVKALVSAGYMKEALRFILISMEKDKEFYRKLAVLEGQNSFKEICERYIRTEVERVLDQKGKEPIHRLLTNDMVADYIAHVVWFITDKWLKYGEDVSALEIVEIYELMLSDSLEEILQEKIER